MNHFLATLEEIANERKAVNYKTLFYMPNRSPTQYEMHPRIIKITPAVIF
jgi:hypothetical protein